MSVINKATILLIALSAIGYTQTAQADFPAICRNTSQNAPVEIDMNLGDIIIPPDLKAGDPIASKEFTVPANTKANYFCDDEVILDFTANLVNPGMDLGDNIYSTNIEGVGIRLSYKNKSGTLSVNYPGTLKTTKAQKFGVAGAIFKVELFQTADKIGTGVIEPRTYSEYVGPDNAVLISTRISGNGIRIIKPSCDIIGGREINVDMGNENLSDFKGVGTKVGKKDIPLDMHCSTGVSYTGRTKIYTSFSGTTPDKYDDSEGVLKNDYEGNENSAKGIGFIMTYDDKPVNFGSNYKVATIPNNGNADISVPLSVSFYQYDKDISAGKVHANVVYNIDYD